MSQVKVHYGKCALAGLIAVFAAYAAVFLLTIVFRLILSVAGPAPSGGNARVHLENHSATFQLGMLSHPSLLGLILILGIFAIGFLWQYLRTSVEA